MATAKTAKKDRHLRHAEYYGLTETFDDLYARSKAQAVFTDLMPLILSEENIRLAYRNIKRNTGSHTAGVDHLTMGHIEKLSSEEVVSKVRHKLAWYKPKPGRRAEIPKPNGKTRPLGIPAIWDRLVQQCILQVLEPICEAKFHNRSNGFRPNRSTEHAIAQASRSHTVQIGNLSFTAPPVGATSLRELPQGGGPYIKIREKDTPFFEDASFCERGLWGGVFGNLWTI